MNLIDIIPAGDKHDLRIEIIVKQSVMLGVVVALYLVNRFIFRADPALAFPLTTISVYLPDLMAPIALFSASNIVFALAGFQLRKLLPMMVFCLFACFVWEFIAPMLIPWSVPDPIDIVLYFVGTLLYWLLNWSFIKWPKSN